MATSMKDQIRRQRGFDAKKETADILIRMLTAFGLFAAFAIIFTLMSIKNAQGGSITSATTDLLMSNEMAEYTVLYGNDVDFDEGDME